MTLNLIHRSLPPLLVALIPGQRAYLDKLKATRERLANELASLINDFGPQIYGDFDNVSLGCLGCVCADQLAAGTYCHPFS